ncbi:MAG: hypothetical protein B7O98_01925 [Zestosphaera tikiterensis]|uniref:ArnR1-like winged helix-turn-helix domain-containing protein n=1 Tax=Zestosphaera tikiterensis TaxID=1973259 RepID=A0A2R7Y6V4_9CREN|nr:MAG: hypothetical protein B7O98_01925 [Zestosphaera tikiterensis]
MINKDFELKQLTILQVLSRYNATVNLLDLHKVIYVLQNKGLVKLKYDFINYSFGPYSKELEEDLNTLARLGLIAVERDGRSMSVSLTKKGKEVVISLNDLSNSIRH